MDKFNCYQVSGISEDGHESWWIIEYGNKFTSLDTFDSVQRVIRAFDCGKLNRLHWNRMVIAVVVRDDDLMEVFGI